MTSNPFSQDPEERQAQALYDFLRGLLPQDDPDVPADEAALGKALHALAQETQASEQFDASLQEILQAEARRRRSKAAVGRLGRTLGWAAVVLALVVGLGWAIRNLLPQPAALGTSTVVGPGVATASPTGCPSVTYVVEQGDTFNKIASDFGVTVETIRSANPASADALMVGQVLSIPRCSPGVLPPSTPLPTLAAMPLPTEALQVYTSPNLPDIEIVMQAEFPETPAEVNLYEQITWEKMTVESAGAAASQMGLPGTAYQPAMLYNSGPLQYIFTDGFGRVTFTDNVFQYHYDRDLSAIQPGEPAVALSEAQIAQIEAFLKGRGMLDFPYQIDGSSSEQIPGRVSFLQLLDGLPVRFSYIDASSYTVQADAQGQVLSMDVYRMNFKPLGSFAIRSPQDAWQKVISPDLQMGMEMSKRSPFSGWYIFQRSHPVRQQVEFYGYLEVLKPVEAGGTPQFFIDQVPLRGNTQGMAEVIEPQLFVQAWGEFQPGETGQRLFQVEGWQASPLPHEEKIGVVQHEGDKAYLVTDTQKLLLPDLPAKVKDGDQVSASGVVLQEPEPTIEWEWLNPHPFGGGGGGGGPSLFDLNLSGTPAALPTPYAVATAPAGQRLEDVTGTPIVTIHHYADGSSKVTADMYIEPATDQLEGVTLRFEGPGAAGIEAYHLLPVRIWGSFTGQSAGLIYTFNLERYEPVYPGVKMQAWLGELKEATIEGKRVALLTAQDGKQYVLNSSLNDGYDLSWLLAGTPVTLEGAVFPDQNLGGYPILQNYYGFSPAGGIKDVSQYQLKHTIPLVSNETGSASMPSRAVIEKIELVYRTEDWRYEDFDPTLPVYVQPMWRFVGRYPDGSYFEILVQALVDIYLK